MSNPKAILVVDDAPANIHTIKAILDGDYTIKVATSGEKALQVAAKVPPPDLILLDVMMPEMDGYEVCRRLKAEPATASIPVVFVTAHADDEERSKGMALGAVAYVSKPVDPDELLANVRRCLEQENRRAVELVAQIAQLDDGERTGRIRVGADADITLFNPKHRER